MSLPSTWGWLYLTVAAACGATRAMAQTKRPFTVVDAIDLRRVVRGPFDSPVLYSPDRRSFVVQTTRGVVRGNVTEDELWLFDMAEVEAATARGTDPQRPAGRVLVTIAAATTDEGVDMGYWQYLYWSQGFDPPWPATFEGRNGGTTFVTGFNAWLEQAPGFNAARVTTPLRTEVYRREGVLYHWEMYVALKMLKRPTEFLFFEDGDHLLVKPRHRYVSLQGNVDWFSFWLKGEEDPEPAKADQYARWRELRKLQQQQIAGDTTATAR